MNSLKRLLQNTPPSERTETIQKMIAEEQTANRDVSTFKKFLETHYPEDSLVLAYAWLRYYGVELRNLFPNYPSSNEITNYFKALLKDSPIHDWPLILKEEIAAVKKEHPEIDSYSKFCQLYFPDVPVYSALNWFSSKGFAIADLFRNVERGNQITNYFKALLKDSPIHDWPLILKEKIARVKEENPEIESYEKFCQHYFPSVPVNAALSWFSKKGIAIGDLFLNIDGKLGSNQITNYFKTVDSFQVKDEEPVLLSQEVKIEAIQGQSISEPILRKRMFPFEQASADTYDYSLPIKKLMLNNREPLRTSYEKLSLFSIPPFRGPNPAPSSSNSDFIKTEGESSLCSHPLK